ncbi:hypothetical protein [Pueribacillus sp. YX66]
MDAMINASVILLKLSSFNTVASSFKASCFSGTVQASKYDSDSVGSWL